MSLLDKEKDIWGRITHDLQILSGGGIFTKACFEKDLAFVGGSKKSPCWQNCALNTANYKKGTQYRYG